jgi:hypothetical protein
MFDQGKHKFYTRKNRIVLHDLLNPGFVINESILGQRDHEFKVEDKISGKPGIG